MQSTMGGLLTCSRAVDASSEGTNWELEAVFGGLLRAEVFVRDVDAFSRSRVIFSLVVFERGTSTLLTIAVAGKLEADITR